MRSMLLTTVFFIFLVFISKDLPAALVHQDWTIEQKVGQMLMVHFNGEAINEEAESLIHEEHVGGFILFNWSNGLRSPKQVRELTEGLQLSASKRFCPIPLLIAVDQEGGAVNRLTEGFTHFPGNRAVVMAGDPEFAYKCAYAMGTEQLAVGVNLTLAPVVDVESKGSKAFIGVRSFSDSPKVVAEYGASALNGYRDAGILSTLKHFPGLGNVSADPHFDSPINHTSMDELMAQGIAPFAALAKHADVIMTGHVVTPAIDPVNCATFSGVTLKLLRETLGFEGVIMTDSLVMEAAAKSYPTVQEAAVKAIGAGCDILLLGGKLLNDSVLSNELGLEQIRSIKRAIVDSVIEGVIDEDQIDRSVERILRLKAGLKRTVDQAFDDSAKKPENIELACLVAELSTRVSSYGTQATGISETDRVLIIAPEGITSGLESIVLNFFKERASVHYFHLDEMHDKDTFAMIDKTAAADTLIVCSYNAHKSPEQIRMVNTLLSIGKPVCLIALGDEEDIAFFPDIGCGISTYSPSPYSIQTAFKYLMTKDATP